MLVMWYDMYVFVESFSVGYSTYFFLFSNQYHVLVIVNCYMRSCMWYWLENKNINNVIDMTCTFIIKHIHVHVYQQLKYLQAHCICTYSMVANSTELVLVS